MYTLDEVALYVVVCAIGHGHHVALFQRARESSRIRGDARGISEAGTSTQDHRKGIRQPPLKDHVDVYRFRREGKEGGNPLYMVGMSPPPANEWKY